MKLLKFNKCFIFMSFKLFEFKEIVKMPKTILSLIVKISKCRIGFPKIYWSTRILGYMMLMGAR